MRGLRLCLWSSLLPFLLALIGHGEAQRVIGLAAVMVVDGQGVPSTVFQGSDRIQIRLTLTNVSNTNVTGRVQFSGRWLVPDVGLTFGPGLCQLNMTRLNMTLDLLCPLGMSLGVPGDQAQYYLSQVQCRQDGGPLQALLPVPSVSFLVDRAPKVGTVSPSFSDPIVLNILLGLPGVSRFSSTQFLANLTSYVWLPKRWNPQVLTTQDEGGGGLQVVIALFGTGNASVMTNYVVKALNSQGSAQASLNMAPPALLGTFCLPSTTNPCSGHGTCHYLDGHCECLPHYQGVGCEICPPTVLDFPATTIVIAALIMLMWFLGWLINRRLWALDRDQLRRKRELFTHLSPLHRTTPGTLIYRFIATAYLAMCYAGCAFPRTSPCYAQASHFFIPQVLRWIRLDLPDVPFLPILAYLLVAIFAPACLYLNKRLTFLVSMDVAAWHRCLDSPATRRLASKSMTWTKPRLRPPGYTPHYTLLVVHLFYPTLAPLILTLLMSSFVCDEVDGAWVARLDHRMACFEGSHIPFVALSVFFLLVYYVCFIISSFIFVAGTERLQNRNLELGLASLIRDRRSAFFLQTQAVILLIGADVFISHVGPWPFTVAGLTVCSSVVALQFLYQLRFSPCNIPLCNWMASVAFLFPVWGYITDIPCFFISDTGKQVAVEVLLGTYASHIILGATLLVLMHRASLGPKGGAPTWFAVRMAEATKREEYEICRINSSKHLSKDDLDFDVDKLLTPRSVPVGSPNRSRGSRRQLETEKGEPGSPKAEKSVLLEEVAMHEAMTPPEATDEDIPVAIHGVDNIIYMPEPAEAQGSRAIARRYSADTSDESTGPVVQSATAKLLQWAATSSPTSSSPPPRIVTQPTNPDPKTQPFSV